MGCLRWRCNGDMLFHDSGMVEHFDGGGGGGGRSGDGGGGGDIGEGGGGCDSSGGGVHGDGGKRLSLVVPMSRYCHAMQ